VITHGKHDDWEEKVQTISGLSHSSCSVIVVEYVEGYNLIADSISHPKGNSKEKDFEVFQ
jgi:hypothetical protein